MGAVRITSLNPKFNRSHFGLPLNSTAWLHASVTSENQFHCTRLYTQNDWLGGNFPFTMTYAHGPHHGWHHVIRKWHNVDQPDSCSTKKVWLIWWNYYDRSVLDKRLEAQRHCREKFLEMSKLDQEVWPGSRGANGWCSAFGAKDCGFAWSQWSVTFHTVDPC